VVLILGTLLYVVEGAEHGFTSIPTSIYWAISTITTVGYGDITPKTDLGRFIASVIMLMGWGTLAVPTGIVTSEMTAQRYRDINHAPTTRCCPECLSEGHAPDAQFCKDCGSKLPSYAVDSVATP
jgi:voltage-gated potassium channel